MSLSLVFTEKTHNRYEAAALTASLRLTEMESELQNLQKTLQDQTARSKIAAADAQKVGILCFVF